MIFFQVRPCIRWQEGTISALFFFKHSPCSHSNIMINTMTKRNSGRVYFIYMSQSQFITGGNQGRSLASWKQDLKQRPQRKAVYQLTPHGLPRLLNDTTQDHLPKVGDQSLTRKMPPLIYQLASLIKNIFSTEVPFPK